MMTPLQDFARSVAAAGKVFNTGCCDVTAWLVLNDTKQAAYAKLVAALPQVKEIRDFWRYVQNMPSAAWLPVIECEILRITYTKHLCRDCRAVAVSWPQHRCAQCQKTRRLETYRKAKQQARMTQRMRKCAVCKVEPLMIPRQRVCASCKANARRERNRRYQKSLKEQKLRRVQADFTRGEMSTVGQNHIKVCRPLKLVDSEGVLSIGAAA